MMKKKVLYLLLATSMILSLIGCGAKEEASAPVASESEVVVEEAKEEVVSEGKETTSDTDDSETKDVSIMYEDNYVTVTEMADATEKEISISYKDANGNSSVITKTLPLEMSFYQAENYVETPLDYNAAEFITVKPMDVVGSVVYKSNATNALMIFNLYTNIMSVDTVENELIKTYGDVMKTYGDNFGYVYMTSFTGFMSRPEGSVENFTSRTEGNFYCFNKEDVQVSTNNNDTIITTAALGTPSTGVYGLVSDTTTLSLIKMVISDNYGYSVAYMKDSNACIGETEIVNTANAEFVDATINERGITALDYGWVTTAVFNRFNVDVTKMEYYSYF